MLANTPAAIIAIVLGLTGPIYVFNDSRRGGQHAAAQAEAELSRGSISAAILCGAFSPEDPFTIDRSYGDSLQAEMALCEGAGCLVLTPSRDRDETRKTDAGCRYFGIADHIIKLALDE
jgi:3-oxoacyl-[acyl-carrier-protein] synthase III